VIIFALLSVKLHKTAPNTIDEIYCGKVQSLSTPRKYMESAQAKLHSFWILSLAGVVSFIRKQFCRV